MQYMTPSLRVSRNTGEMANVLADIISATC